MVQDRKRPYSSLTQTKLAFGPAEPAVSAENGDSVDESEQSETFEVEKILKHRLDHTGNITFLVRWNGYGPGDDTWEPVENLDNCPEIFEAYKAQLTAYGESIDEHKHKCAYVLKRMPKKSRLEFTIGDKCTSIHMRVESSAVHDLKPTKPDMLQKIKEWQAHINILCKQRNEAAITIVNELDNECPPEKFEYIADYILGKGAKETLKDGTTDAAFTLGCDCKDICGQKGSMCCPQLLSDENDIPMNYTKFGKVRIDVGQYPIYECNSKCNCGPECPNRVVQKGRKVPLQIFRTKNRGWGVRAMSEIKKGTFVAEYVGEIITTEEAEERGKETKDACTYLFDLDYHDGDPDYTVDARHFGNVAHFFNHSCDPNLINFSVWIENQDASMPRIAFFAAREIAKNEELTFDYKTDYVPTGSTPAKERKEKKVIRCHCGAKKCRKYLRQ